MRKAIKTGRSLDGPDVYWQLPAARQAPQLDTGATSPNAARITLAEQRSIALEVPSPVAKGTDGISPPPTLRVRKIDGESVDGRALGDVLRAAPTTTIGGGPLSVTLPVGGTVEVIMSGVAPDAKSKGEAQADAFDRSLTIMRQLRQLGAQADSITVKMPTDYLVGTSGKSAASGAAAQDTIVVKDKAPRFKVQ